MAKKSNKQKDLERRIVKAAEDKYGEQGSIEIDSNTTVTYSSDGGYYVQAWVYVTEEEVKA